MSMTIRSGSLSGAARHTTGLVHARRYAHMRGSLPDMTASRLYQTHVASRPLAQRFMVQRRWQHTAAPKEGFIQHLNKILILGSVGSFVVGAAMAVTFMVYPNDEDLPEWMQTVRHHISRLKYQGLSRRDLDVAQSALTELKKIHSGVDNLQKIQQNLEDLQGAKAIYKQDFDDKLQKEKMDLVEQKKIIIGNQKKYETDLKALVEAMKLLQQSTPEEVIKAHRNEKLVELFFKCKDDQCLKDLHGFLKSTTSSIHIDGQSLPHFKSNFAIVLGEALESNLNPTVMHLDLGNSDIKSNRGLFRILESLEKNTTIKTLKLNHTAIGHDDPNRSEIHAIAHMLVENKTIEELNLFYTYLKKEDLSILGDALEKNQALKKINLGETYIKSKIDIDAFVDRINKTRNDDNKITVEHTAS